MRRGSAARWRARWFARCLTLGLALLAGPWGLPASAAPTLQELTDADWIAQGRKRFVSACAYCHGQQGEAGKVKSFKERPGWDPARIREAIANGSTRNGNLMPAWKDSIPDAEIWKIVAYIKSLTPGEDAASAVKP